MIMRQKNSGGSFYELPLPEEESRDASSKPEVKRSWLNLYKAVAGITTSGGAQRPDMSRIKRYTALLQSTVTVITWRL